MEIGRPASLSSKMGFAVLSGMLGDRSDEKKDRIMDDPFWRSAIYLNHPVMSMIFSLNGVYSRKEIKRERSFEWGILEFADAYMKEIGNRSAKILICIGLERSRKLFSPLKCEKVTLLGHAHKRNLFEMEDGAHFGIWSGSA